jgi:hypothetical protein
VLLMEAVAVGRNISIHAVRIHLVTRPRLGILRHALTTFANLLKLGRLDLSAAI